MPPLCWADLDTSLPQYTHSLTQSPPSVHKLLRPREGLLQSRKLSSHYWLGSIRWPRSKSALFISVHCQCQVFLAGRIMPLPISGEGCLSPLRKMDHNLLQDKCRAEKRRIMHVGSWRKVTPGALRSDWIHTKRTAHCPKICSHRPNTCMKSHH